MKIIFYLFCFSSNSSKFSCHIINGTQVSSSYTSASLTENCHDWSTKHSLVCFYIKLPESSVHNIIITKSFEKSKKTCSKCFSCNFTWFTGHEPIYCRHNCRTNDRVYSHNTKKFLNYHQSAHNLEVSISRPSIAGDEFYNRLPAHIKLNKDNFLFRRQLK